MMRRCGGAVGWAAAVNGVLDRSVEKGSLGDGQRRHEDSFCSDHNTTMTIWINGPPGRFRGLCESDSSVGRINIRNI
jgi:hypothetical protein